MKRILCLILTSMLTILLCIPTYSAPVDSSFPESDTENANATWEITQDGILTILGTGVMDSYANKTLVPWSGSADQITGIEIAEGITTISDYAFYGLNKVTSVSIPDSVTIIGKYAFKNCTLLKEVSLSDHLITLGDSAYYNCISLEEITIPASVTTIGAYCFAKDTALKNITFEGDIPEIGEGAFNHTEVKLPEIPDTPDSDTDPHGHPLKLISYQTPTAKVPGHIAYWECKICNKMYFDKKGVLEITPEQVVIPATGELLSYKAEHDWITNSGRSLDRAIISFVDDDCRTEVYTKLFDIIKETNVPYTLACPPDCLGREDYMTEDQLMEMVNSGVGIASHHLVQLNMDQTNFKTPEAYEAELEGCDAKFAQLGLDVQTLCYPQGIYIPSYLPVVKNHYRAAFTVENGINYTPYNSYSLKRCEVFPKAGTASLATAKSLVKEAIETKGWLILMTHAWYDTFDANELKELIQYVKKQDVDILSVNDALKKSGNVIEIGDTTKEKEQCSEPFFVTSASGKTQTNNLTIYDASPEVIKPVSVKYYTKSVLRKSGSVATSKDDARIVSLPVPVKEGDELYITGCAAWGNCVYAICGEDGKVLKDESGEPLEGAYLASDSEGTELIITDQKITIPEGAASIMVASSTAVQPSGYKIARTETIADSEAAGLVFVKRDGTKISVTAEQIEKLLKLIEE